MAFLSPLRYPGGKGRLGPFLAEIIRSNGLGGRKYFEFYAGGAGSALYLLKNGLVEEIVINDLDERIYSFWHAILRNTNEFLARLDACKVDMEAWHRHREICLGRGSRTELELGFSAFFLNRVNRSGILEAGVIGGKRQCGKYRLDARFNKTGLKRRIMEIAKLKERIKLSQRDACEILERDFLDPEKYIFFFDPPYYVAKQQLYRNLYGKSDHIRLARLIKALGTPWVATYNSCAEIREIYRGCSNLEFDIPYCAQTRRRGHESLYYGNLRLPSCAIFQKGRGGVSGADGG